MRCENGELIDIENLFAPYTGRVFSFNEIGTFKVEVKSSYGKYECTVYVATNGKDKKCNKVHPKHRHFALFGTMSTN